MKLQLHTHIAGEELQKKLTRKNVAIRNTL